MDRFIGPEIEQSLGPSGSEDTTYGLTQLRGIRGDDRLTPCLVGPVGGEDLRCLEQMGEGGMTDVVEQGRDRNEVHILRVDASRVDAIQHPHQPTGEMVGTERVREPSVVG